MPPARYLQANLLRRYFYSGWAVLIPYLAVYLLYYVTNWPVNPPTGPLTNSPSPLAPPSLLHLYWALHALHFILAVLALRSWWTGSSAQYVRSASDSQSAPYSSYRLHLLTRIAPWAILALIFYIPGVYLEWPSDPWEHLRRINEWRILDTVGAHSSWSKSAYFMPYSLLNWCVGLRQLFWLDFYYTGICLLLCWQYYRLSRACGLGERASMVFVIIQAFLFGNNIFSFYRYYGISSSIYAQIGAVALTRLVLEWAAFGNTNLNNERGSRNLRIARRTIVPVVTKSEDEESIPSSVPITTRSSSEAAQTSPSAFQPFNLRPSFWHLPTLFRILSSGACLLLLVVFNHPQGIGIAGLGVIAVLVWRLTERRRSYLTLLIVSIFIINILFLWLYPRPAIIETYRAQGYLNAWYGFNIADLTSPAGERMLHIVGALGLLSSAFALGLIRRNHVVGWLTLLPTVSLFLPCCSIPLSWVLSARGDLNIVTFHRLFLAIPCFLSLAAWINYNLNNSAFSSGRFRFNYKEPAAMVAVGWLLFASTTIVPPSGPQFNRLWSSISSTPNDFKLRDICKSVDQAINPLPKQNGTMLLGLSITRAMYPSELQLVPHQEFRSVAGSPVMMIEQTIMAADQYISHNNHYYFPLSDSSIMPIARESIVRLETPKLLANNARTLGESTWSTLGGHAAEFTSASVGDSNGDSLVIQNPVGLATHVFTSLAAPVHPSRRYNLEITVRQAGTRDAKAYLAAAWYGADGALLASNLAPPQGAGFPQGWHNGMYSYFGLVDDIAPKEWTTYKIALGTNEPAAIPEAARYIRIGALLNFHSTNLALVQITNARLYEEPMPVIIVVNAYTANLYSPTSTSALLSSHWQAQQNQVDRAGSQEIKNAANALAK